MAIEFDCPRCSATIRVPDAYSGRQGRCPQCNERLLVPVVAIPTGAAGAGPSPAAWAPVAGAAPAAGVEHVGNAGAGGFVPGAAAAGAVAGGGLVAQSSAVSAGAPAVAGGVDAAGGVLRGVGVGTSSRPGGGRSSSLRSRRRGPSRVLIVGMPVIGFLLLLAILALTIDFGGPELSGELTGRVLAEKSLPRTIVSWSELGVTADEQQVLQSALTEHPETFSSDLLVCRLGGQADGLEIQLTAASGAKWCAVNPHDANQKALSLWLKQQRERLGAQRRSEMSTALSLWCRDKLQQIQGQQISIDAGQARDLGVLNATVDSLGYAVQGRTGKRLVRAAAEDDTGWLYFCVPADAETLTVEGRALAGVGTVFPGQYEVTIGTAPAGKVPETPAGAVESNGEAGEAMPESGSESKSAPASGADEPGGTMNGGSDDGEGAGAAEGGGMSEGSGGAAMSSDKFGEAMKGMFSPEGSSEESKGDMQKAGKKP